MTEKDISLARKVPKAGGYVRPEDIFSGERIVEKSRINDVGVLKLQCVPDADHTAIATEAVILPPEIVWQPSNQKALPFGLTWQQSSSARYDLLFELPEHVRCFGLGERFSNLNLRGRSHTLCNTDNSKHNETADSLYLSVPFLILYDGALSYALFLDSAAPQRWSLDAELDSKCRVELLSTFGWSCYLFGPAPLSDLLGAYSTMTGRTALPPLWSLGHQQSRWSYAHEERVIEIAREFRERKLPCDAVVLDVDYMNEYRTFSVSPERFPNFEQMCADLKKQNFKVITILDPGIKLDANFAVFKDGIESGVFCKNADGAVFVDEAGREMRYFPIS